MIYKLNYQNMLILFKQNSRKVPLNVIQSFFYYNCNKKPTPSLISTSMHLARNFQLWFFPVANKNKINGSCIPQSLNYITNELSKKTLSAKNKQVEITVITQM